MSTMVEKVARAIHFRGDDQGDDAWNHCQSWIRAVAREQARAAIEAMMDPTEAMITAGEGEDIFTANGTLVSCASALTHYEVMTQAALKEEGQ